jgi:transposase
MRGYLSREVRLQTSVTRLKKGNEKLRSKVKELNLIIKEKNQKISELKEKLSDKESQRKELLTFLYKPKKQTANKQPLGKKHGSPGFHRAIPKESDVTESLTYTLNTCPICEQEVGQVVDTVIKYEEDITLKPKPTITKHTITRHWCKHCDTYVKSKHIPPISRIGINTLGYILYARYRLRLPIKKIQESLSDLYNFKISEGEIIEKLKEAKEMFGKDYEAIIAIIQEAKRVYADETGWKMDGKNWWLWVFVTDKGVRYVIEDTRGKGVAERALGKKEDRVIISDGYAVYQKLPGDKQQCWVHLMRKAKLASPELYEDLVLLYKKLLIELEKPLIERDRKKYEDQLETLIKKKYTKPLAKKVQERMTRHKPFLFTCLSYDNVLPENNTAERAIRHQVVMRKIFGGSRSLSGVKTHEVNTSVIETMRKQNPDQSFFDIILPLLNERRSEV